METWKECSIVLLHTDEPSIIHLWSNEFGTKPALCELEFSNTRNTQHLYILSNEEIKEGDWVYNKRLGQIFKINSINSPSATDYKIIATTNPELIKDGLAEVSNKFLKEWIKNPVDKLLVEYFSEVAGEIRGEISYYEPELLIANNTINCKFIKDDWDSIFNEFKHCCEIQDKVLTLIQYKAYLENNYNPPTKK